jgi:hypothetical protein
MSWRDLLQTDQETAVFPWVGGRSLQGSDNRVLTIDGRTPREFGWYRFKVKGRKALSVEAVPAEPENLRFRVRGYLVGDRVVPDGVRVDPDPAKIASFSEKVFLIEDGLDRFVRISAGRVYEGGPLVYSGPEMPLGPEDDVLNAYLDQKGSVDTIAGVSPALDAAFRMETWHRVDTERRRAEAERKRQEEEARRQLEQRRQQLVEQLGDGAGRRAMALVDFRQAAQAALALSGAEYLDHRRAVRGNEMVVRFRLDGQRFECTCDQKTLQILDSGICLTAHWDDADGFEHNTKGDTWFTLESLPSVIREAVRGHKLVVYRHVH